MQACNDKTLTIDRFPRCAGYLAAMRIKPPYTGMTDYWCAVAISESFSDKTLRKIGTVDFSTMTGTQLLGAFEAILATGRKPNQPKSAGYDKWASSRKKSRRERKPSAQLAL